MTDTVRVAVVEDHDSMRTALVRLLESSGLEASAFNCADDFLNHPECTKFDCVVIDLHLPRKDGLQLQKELKQVAPFAAQIFISGHADLKVGMNAIRQGAVDFLEKPIDDQALLEALRRGADGSRKHRAALTARITLEARPESLTPRARSLRPDYQWPAEHTSRLPTRHHRTHHQGPSPPRHAKDGGKLPGRPGAHGSHTRDSLGRLSNARKRSLLTHWR